MFHSDFGNKIVNSKSNHEADSESKLISQKMMNSKFIRKTDTELIVNTRRFVVKSQGRLCINSKSTKNIVN